MRLNLLGGACVDTQAGLLTGRAAQRHRTALLALLAAAPSQAMSRDRLIARLWPEHDTDRARHLLNVTVHILRGALGNAALLSSGDDLRLDTSLITCDAVDFQALVSSGEHEAAVRLYRGPYLDGFFLKGSPEFEEWVTWERERLARLYHAALEHLAERAEREGDLLTAVSWWRRQAAEQPYNARLAMRLMRVLHGAGDPEGAFEHARVHGTRVATELGTDADPAIAELVSQLRGVSTRPPTPWTIVTTEKEIDAGLREGAPSILLESPAAPRRRASRRWLATAALPAAMAVIWLSNDGFQRGPEPEPERLLILPFTYRGAGHLAYLGEGLVELLATRIGDEGIHPVEPSFVHAALRQAGDSVPDPAESRSMARRVGAGRYITGTVIQLGPDYVELRATLLDSGEREAVLARASARGNISELARVVDELARELAIETRDLAKVGLARLAARTTSSGPALNAYLQGESLMRRAHLRPALAAFQRAIDADSTFALAHYRVARVAPGLGGDPAQARAELTAALRHGSSLSRQSRLLIEAYAAYLDGRAAEADRLYAAIAREHPDDLEAAYMGALTALYYGPVLGLSMEESKLRFQRLLALDPAHTMALTYRLVLAVRGRERSVVDSLWPLAYPERSPLMMRTLRSFAFEEGDGQRAALSEIAQLRGDMMASWRLAVDLRDWEGAEVPARMLVRADNPAARRAEGHLTLAYLAAVRGRFRAARRELAAIPKPFVALALEHGAFLATLPFAPMDSVELDRLRAALASPSPPAPEATSGATPEAFVLAAHDSVRGVLQPFLVELLSARLGEARAAGGGQGSAGDFGRTLWAGLRAELTFRQQDGEAALSGLDPSLWSMPSPLIVQSPFFARIRERYLWAEMLRSLDRSDEALAWYGAFAEGEMYFFDLVALAPAELRQAEIMDKTGRLDQAALHYARFIDLWTEADAELQPLVRDARQRLKRVNASRGASTPSPPGG